MQRATINVILLIVVIFFTSACSGTLFVSPTPTPTPTATLTPTPQPTNTSTPTKTPRPTRTSIPPSPTPELPQGTPLAEWSGFPIMPNAIAGELDEPVYSYIVKVSPEDAALYYVDTLPKFGWKFVHCIPMENIKEFCVLTNDDGNGYTFYLGFSIGYIFIYDIGEFTEVNIFHHED